MTDLSHTIIAKSDQLNADDLIGGPRTIKVKKVLLRDTPDQPIAVHYEGGDGKPYLPCKSMRRAMVMVWGPDGNAFVGRSMTLYRDPSIRFGPDEVGGIRISHMSHIDKVKVLALTVKRGSRKPYEVKPLKVAEGQAQQRQAPVDLGKTIGPDSAPPSLEVRVARFKERCMAATTKVKLAAVGAAAEGLRDALIAADPEGAAELDAWFDARAIEVDRAQSADPDADDHFPGAR